LERYARSRGKKEEIRSLLNELSLKENNGDWFRFFFWQLYKNKYKYK
jgi:hypothetical protein